MSSTTNTLEKPLTSQGRLTRQAIELLRSYSWSSIVVGAIAMAATYPGRTHGLGMVTEPLLKDLGLESNDGRVLYATLGFWATLLGASFCIPVGWLLDKVGQSWVLFGNLILLGLSVLLLSFSTSLTQDFY